MSLRNSNTSFGKMTIALHWIMAILIIGVIFAGFYMGTLEKGDFKSQVVGLHKSTGFLILLIVLFRWYWTLSSEKVAPLASWSKADTAVAHATKWLLMVMMLVMPLSGWFMSMSKGYTIDFYWLFELPILIEKSETLHEICEEIHEIGALVITAIAAVHILAALKHHLMDKDDTINRMLGR
ncbi:MAG: cytochrome b [Gammaproteobacteria bacterium]|nr:cytochrome b [Gammaproteobacteria bacterium]MDH5630785.1 cytochrome b [Gammaproteobacteria bacterium]